MKKYWILPVLLAILFAPVIFGFRLSFFFLVILLLSCPLRLSKTGYTPLLFVTLFTIYATLITLASSEPSRLYLAVFFFLVLVTIPSVTSAIDRRRLGIAFVSVSTFAVSIGYLELFGPEIAKQAIWYIFKQTSVTPNYSDYAARFIFKHSGMAQNIPASGWLYFMMNVTLYLLARDSLTKIFVTLCVFLGLSSIFLMAAGGSRSMLFATLFFYCLIAIGQPRLFLIGAIIVFPAIYFIFFQTIIHEDSEMFHLLFELSASLEESESLEDVKQINSVAGMFAILGGMNTSEWLFGMLSVNTPYIESDSGVVRLLVQYGVVGGLLYLAAVASHIYRKLQGLVSFQEKLLLIYVVIAFFTYSIKGDFLFGYYSLPGLIFLLNYWRSSRRTQSTSPHLE